MFITWRLHGRFYRGYGCLGKLALDSFTMKKKAAELNSGTILNPHVTCVINGCQGKIFGVYSDFNYSMHQHALALDVIQVLDGWNYFQSY